MKELFTFGGLPHYHNVILNKLNNVENLENDIIVFVGENSKIEK